MNYRLFRLSVLLLLFVPALFAQETFSVRHIEAALEDELYPLAKEQIWEALSVDHTPTDEATLTLLLIRTLIGQHKFDEAIILADESTHLPQQDAFCYWRARALFGAGQFKAVSKALETLPTESSYAPAALRLRGRAELASGDFRAAQKSFETFHQKFPDNENAAQNLLDLAGVYLKRNKKSASEKTLRELLESFPKSELADSARLQLARQLIADGGQEKQTEAAGLFRSIGSSETAHPRLRIAAWVELASIEQRSGRPAVAADMLAKAETLTSDANQRVYQKAARANLLIEEGKNTEAFALFNEAIKEAANASVAAEILIQKAEALLKTGQYPEAEAAFQAYLDVTADSASQARALTGKGWSLWEQKRYEEAAVAFENSASKFSNPVDGVSALVKAGDARLAANQYEKAHEDYHKITESFPTHPLAARAMYQSGVASLLANKTDAARLEFAQTETDFPESEFAPQAAFQLANLLKQEQQWNLALEEYHRIAVQYTNVVVQATALHQQGLIFYRTGQWDKALKAFRVVSEKYPNAPEAPQAYYMCGFCRYLQGDTDAAVAICNGFIENYPDSVWTPEVLFWLAEHYYNRGNYVKANTMFLDIVTRFPKHELA
ncbi:MAG: hypothetical protein PWQ29_1531, partial [Verrucomicrobiota bacterium]|nr:hypothetical protein [Verrucomicrobiota bacterium]